MYGCLDVCISVGETGVLDIVGRRRNSNSYRGVIDMYVWRLSFLPQRTAITRKKKKAKTRGDRSTLLQRKTE